jgi:alkylation response protein AidB-like acyl-CoA dehydrogenase
MEVPTVKNKKKLENLESIFKRCGERAAGYDRENRFFTEDFEELKEAGYLLMPIPEELGGYGYSMAEVMEKQRALAYFAAPTALALNMHLYWMGAAADLRRMGDRSLEWLLREGAKGEVFAAGHAESGNDHPVVWSTTEAVPVKGGYRFRGHKHFSSLTPVWTYMGLHGLDTSDPENPRVVHAFVPRDTPGVTIKRTWDDVLGMRATRSDDTILVDVFVPEEYIATVVPAGFKNMAPLTGTSFIWFLAGISNIYLGLARQIFDRTLGAVQRKKSMALTRPLMIHHPGIQNDIAEIFIELEGMTPQIDRLAQEWSSGIDHGQAWPLKFIAAKARITEAAWRIADRSIELAGGFGIFPASHMERLFRDARLGRIHPTNTYLSREMIGKAMLGIDWDEQPRWG